MWEIKIEAFNSNEFQIQNGIIKSSFRLAIQFLLRTDKLEHFQDLDFFVSKNSHFTPNFGISQIFSGYFRTNLAILGQ